LNIAVSDKNSEQKLFLHEGGGWHSIVNKSKNYIKVKTRKLDTIIKEFKINIKKIKLIKIDVEGAENLVFKGAKKFLRHSDSEIIFEATNENQLKKLKKFLRKFNYKVIRINKVNFLATKNINSFSF
jgi:hypothetical protein